ncbi:MAG: hypothetical protein HY905_14520 [Deltaproteobacteria bacterium]|nr:hypothetical protein [Deltaproteobacteria bacterium]
MEAQAYVVSGQFWGDAIIMFVGGCLAASSFILAKKPNAKALFEKVAPYQGSIGVAMFAWGIWHVLYLVLNLKIWKDMMFGMEEGAMGITIKAAPSLGCRLFAINWIVGSVIMVVLGFLLGFGMIQAYAGKKNPAVAAKSEAMMKKLAPHQTWLGFVGIISGLLFILLMLGIPKMVHVIDMSSLKG